MTRCTANPVDPQVVRTRSRRSWAILERRSSRGHSPEALRRKEVTNRSLTSRPSSDNLQPPPLLQFSTARGTFPVVVLKKLAGSFKGRLWAYLDPLGRQVVYDATATHERAGPEAFLAGFRGYLQADAYTGYDALYASGRITEVGCWAHGRRRFREALETDPRAASMLALVQELYRVEREAESLSPEERKAERQKCSVPVLARIDELHFKLEAEVLPKSPLGEALRYLGNQWTALNRFVLDGRLRPDNNGAESQLRIVAVGRKNWLFAGSLTGARWAATLFSLVQSCRLAGIDPFLYFRDVLQRVPTHPQRLIGQLTPRAWAETLAKAVAA